jgi:hypothetical protein
MLNPQTLINDLFDDKNFADYKLRGFTEDHLIRLSIPANNPASIYSPLITDITTKYNNFFGKITNVATKEAISEGLTITMQSARTAALAQLVKLEGLVTFKFGKTSPTYQEFYPQGLSEYHDADLPQLPALLARFLTATNTHLVLSNPMDVNDTMVLFGNFNTARTAQLTVFAEVDTLQTGKREDRKLLTLGLTTGMLTIAINNLENADNFNNYYNPSYLPLQEAAISVSGLINFNSIIMAVDTEVVTQSSNLRLFNQGIEPLIFSINDQPGVIHPVYQMQVMPGTDVAFNQTLPVFAEYYINIQNASAIANGKWKVVIS